MLRPGRVGGSLPTSYGGNDMSSSQEYGGYGGYGSSNTSNGSAYGGYSGGSSNGYSGHSNSGSTAYGGYTNHANTDFKDKSTGGKYNRHGPSPLTIIFDKLSRPWIGLALLSFILTITTLSYRSKYTAVLKMLDVTSGGVKEAKAALDKIIGVRDARQRQINTLQEQQRKALTKNTECENDKRKIMKERDDLRNKHEGPESIEEKNRIVTRENAWKEQLNLLQLSIQRESRRSVVDKYGPGPHYVEITVDITSLPEDESMKSFVVELAPLSLMPHAVHLFLEQVHHKLWNNAWFYVNGPHVLQGGPQADEEELDRLHESGEEYDERELAVRPFREKNLETLSFSEYSDSYKHMPWTLGFTGRPGGPDFYINKVDNSESHGPGGQQHHQLVEFADACFARVYSGFDTLDAILRSPIILDDPSYKYFFEDPVHIIRAKVLKGPPVRSQHDMWMLQLPKDQIERELQLQKERLQKVQLPEQQQQQQTSALPRTSHGHEHLNANAQAEAIGNIDHVEGHHKPKRHIAMPENTVEV